MLLKDITQSILDNLIGQRDDALSRIDKYDAEKAKLVSDNQAAVAAIQTKMDEAAKAHGEELAKVTAEGQAAIADVMVQAQQDRDALVAVHKADMDGQAGKLAAVQALVDSMGGTPLGQKLQRQKERDALAAQIAAAAKAKADAEVMLASKPPL